MDWGQSCGWWLILVWWQDAARCSLGFRFTLFYWLVLVCCERKLLLAGGGWWLMLVWCERKILLAGAGAGQQNRVNMPSPRCTMVNWGVNFYVELNTLNPENLNSKHKPNCLMLFFSPEQCTGMNILTLKLYHVMIYWFNNTVVIYDRYLSGYLVLQYMSMFGNDQRTPICMVWIIFCVFMYMYF